MAVLKDLIVHGRSRFVNGIDADSIHANLIDANDGVFKTITTTTLDAETITTDMLKANNARVSQTLTVDGTISTNKWEAANIANIGGNFYISPTGKADSGTITVTKTGSTIINGVTVGVYTLVVGGGASFGVTSTNSTVWGPTSGNQSKVIFTGSISYNNSKKYPLGTCNGTMTALSTGTNTLTGFTITGVNSPALDIFFQEVGVSSVSSTACNGYEMQISVYQTYSNSALRPVGILLTSYGKEKKQYIDIYNGENSLGDSASGFANPAVRIGLLDDLPNIVDNSTDTATKPSGWGIYTTNGFFRGKVVANAGRIATWNIGSTSIYSGTNSMTSTTQGTYIGTGTDATSGIRNYKDANTFVNISQGVITAKAVDLTGKITATSGSIAGWRIESSYLASGSATSPAANVLLLSPAGTTSSYTIAGQAKTGWVITAGTTFGVNKDGGIYATSGKIGGFDIGTTYLRNGNITSATNTSVAGIYLGTDGLNISNGTAATTSYITKTAVNIGNKLIWNGTTLTIDGSASIGGTAASTVVSNASQGAAAKTELDNLQIGGKNLIPLSLNLKAFTVENSSYATATWTDTDVTVLNINTGTYGIYYQWIPIEANTTYTLSFTSTSIVGTARSSGGFRKADGTTIGSALWNHTALNYAQVSNGRNIRTFTTPDESATMRLYFSVSDKDSKQIISQVKLEKGNKATDWSPAPEDLDVHKYVTDIDSNGIWVTPSGKKPTNTSTGAGATGTRLNGDGLQVYKAGVQVASYGTDATIGQVAANLYNVFIDADGGISLRKNQTSLLTINSSQIDINNSSGNVITRVNGSGLTIYNGSGTAATNQLAFFGSTATIGASNATHTNIDSTGMKIYASDGTTLIAHLGYGEGAAQTSGTTATAPYCIFGLKEPNTTNGNYSVGEGYHFNASGWASHAEGYYTQASGSSSHAEGDNTIARGSDSHAEGYQVIANGDQSHAEGYHTRANNDYSHVEGYYTKADGDSCHAEGESTTASNVASHAEGKNTTASGYSSHAEGYGAIASGNYSHAEGYYTKATQPTAHAEGGWTIADGSYSHANGKYTVATEEAQTVIGKYNTATRSGSGTEASPYTYSGAGNYAFIIGNGSGDATAARSNAFMVDWLGNIYPQATKMVDFVVDQGTSGIWTYRKWNSGISECWGMYTWNITSWSTWSGWYYANASAAVAYPSSLFVATPTLTTNGNISTNDAVLYCKAATNGAVNTPTFSFFRPAAGAANTTGQLSFYAAGRWK